MRILVLNSGSSSIKFKILELSKQQLEGVDTHNIRSLVSGEVKGIGGLSSLELRTKECAPCILECFVKNHDEAVRWVFQNLGDLQPGTPSHELYGLLASVDAVGLRVVHGGEVFPTAVLVDDVVLGEIKRLSELTPLHTPGLLATLRLVGSDLRPKVPIVAVFDTAFHHGLPPRAMTYAIPQQLAARHGIRRFGFHGIAHASVLEQYVATSGRRLPDVRVISLHLGSGCSAAAINGGKSIDTSMGFTPLEGLVMGTRCGDLDPAIVGYLVQREGVTGDEVVRRLNEHSGLLGLSNRSSNMRTLLQAAEQERDPQAMLAIDVFCYRARKYIGAYLAALDGAEAILFSGGIGENSPEIRERICEGMKWCGLSLDVVRNASAVGVSLTGTARISTDEARIGAFVMPADEETRIARETVAVIANLPKGSRP
jgi:acetate kinase